jgi:phage major head subunit gpT-like protein
MIVPADLATGWSTRFDTLFRDQFNQSVAVMEAQMSPLIMPMELGDFQGNKVTLDWLGASPQMRKWVDEKRAIGLSRYAIDVVVERFEATVELDLDALRDGRGNIYEPRIREIAQNGSRLEYNLVSDLIKNGETGLAYDGQNFFDTDHSEGDSGSQSNELTGTGTTVAQLKTDYYAAKSALMGFKDDKGVPLHPYDFRPVVWIPNQKALIEGFDELRNATLTKGGDSNVLRDRFDLVIDPRLTDANDWYMARPDTVMKPFFRVRREPVHYVDNFGTGHPDVWSRRIGQAGAEGRMAMAYGMWQCIVLTKNA